MIEAGGGRWNRKAKAHLFDGDAGERLDQILLSGRVDVPKDEFDFFPTPAPVVAEMLAYLDPGAGDTGLEPSAGQGAIALPCAARGAQMDCYELMDANFAALAAHPALRRVTQADFLQVEPRPVYDFVAMNPPFKRQADIRHVQHALGFVRPGGRLAAIMAAGMLFRENRLTVAFRDEIARRGGSVTKMPEGAFKSSGTMVGTVMVTVRG